MGTRQCKCCRDDPGHSKRVPNGFHVQHECCDEGHTNRERQSVSSLPNGPTLGDRGQGQSNWDSEGRYAHAEYQESLSNATLPERGQQ